MDAGSRRELDTGVEPRPVCDDVIRRQNKKQGVLVVTTQHERGDGCGGRCVPAIGLQDDRLRLYTDLSKLLGHDEPMLVVADDKRCGKARGVGNATGCFLQKGEIGDEREELLGIKRS